MNKFKDQFYNEGFATTFYKKPIKYIEKHVKSKKKVKVLSFIIKIIYTILVILFALYILYIKLA